MKQNKFGTLVEYLDLKQRLEQGLGMIKICTVSDNRTLSWNSTSALAAM